LGTLGGEAPIPPNKEGHTMALRIGSFEIEIGLGYFGLPSSLSIQAGSWDLYWNHLHRELVLCRGMATVYSL
jgi:hypothetical protein